jgi:uncharacterized repeat protein (TIGR03803 family)
MRNKKLSIGMTVALAIFVVASLATGPRAAAQIETYSFNGKDGSGPLAGLIFDASGNLYGTTSSGGAAGGGTAFELIPKAGGGWTQKILHSFGTHSNDGVSPYAAMILDSAGNLYGTTSTGGAHGLGTAFELTPREAGGWTEKILYSFGAHSNDGANPYAAMILDSAGNLYGTTFAAGAADAGAAFELTPKAGGGWTEKILYSFGTHSNDGANPYAAMILDSAGNLYGTTVGSDVFELMPEAGGGWGEKILLNFNGTDGANSYGSLTFDAAGNLYGTTIQGGTGSCEDSAHCGTVFELTPQANGTWGETVLHNFGGAGDGTLPYGNVIFDAAGNLYGTTSDGGTGLCARSIVVGCGTVFVLSPNTSGGWTETVLHNFQDEGDGYWPYAGLIFDAAGNLYGTTQEGGFHGLGTVFKITP